MTGIFSIDLGLDNFTACIPTKGTSFILEGRGIKSFNRWWNKEKARLQSIYTKQGIKKGRKLCYLYRKRKSMINEYINKNVHYIIQHCLKNKIGNIVIGELKNIKQGINIWEKEQPKLHKHPIHSI